MSESVDAVVVGAGLAGLTAAHTLASAGRTVRVLEADGAVGGRTRTGELEGGVLAEFGGEWVGPRHRHVLRLAEEFGMHVRKAGQLGRPFLWCGATKRTIRRFPMLPLREEWALLRACWRLERLGRTVDPIRPWSSPASSALDGRAFGEWLRANGVTGDGFRYLATVVGALTSAQIEHVSLLHVVWWLARGGGLLRVLHTTFAYNFVEGAQTLSVRLADRLDDAVRLHCAVRRIVHNDQVRVETVQGSDIRAREVIVTASVGTLSRIAFDPPLPAALAALDELRGHSGTKVTGLLPSGHSPRHRAVVGGDAVVAAWRVDSRITGYTSLDHVDADAEMLIDELAAHFHTSASELRAAIVYRWSQHHHIPACDIGFAPGQLRRHGPNLTRAYGRIHFAGAERGSWPNNMEGAVESGRNAARAVLAG